MSAKASGGMTAVLAKVGEAKDSMTNALGMERKVSALRDALWERAKQSAEGEVPKMLKKLRKKANKKAEKKAKKKAKAFEAAMKKKAKVEKAKATKIYMDVMAGAGKAAAKFAEAGDGLIAQASNLQMNSGLAQGQANQFLAIGNMADAQKQMQQARIDMDTALGLNAQATGLYDTANTITAQLPAYAGQAAMAGYHAEVMYDPNAVAPPKPLVFAQEGKRHRRSEPLLSAARRAQAH